MRHVRLAGALVTVRAAALATAAAISGCAGSAPPSLSLSLSEPSAPADGIGRVQATVRAAGLGPAAVVSFELAGPGLLSSTQVRVADGMAAVDIYAPFESELAGGAAAATVTARALADPLPVAATADLSFTIPTGGAPVLLARASPDRVRAGGTEPITLVIEGRRLTDATVALTGAGSAVTLPQSMTLVQAGALFQGQLEIAPPAEPASVEVTVTGGGAPPVSITLRFIGEGEADFDVSGLRESIAPLRKACGW